MGKKRVPGKRLKGLFKKLADDWHKLPDEPFEWTFGKKAKTPGTHTFPGTKMDTVKYTKRSKPDKDALREAFNKNGRQDFLNWAKDNIPEDQLKKAGFTKSEIADFKAEGLVPSRYQVHHRLPLDDGGTNEFDNLVILKNSPDHNAVTQHQIRETRGMKPGESRNIGFPFSPPGIYVWPL